MENPVDIPRSHPEILRLSAEKRAKLRSWLAKTDLDGVIISRRDNFAWLTCGGDNRVVNFSEVGCGHLVITPNKQYLVSYYMDSDRYLLEQVPEQGYEQVTLNWFQGDERQYARELIGEKVGADTFFPGTIYINDQIMDLHWPLTDLEVARLRWLARTHSAILENVFQQVIPGMSEIEIKTLLYQQLWEAGLEMEVAIVGSDERIHQFRHVLATEKRLEKYLLLGPVVRKWGLFSFISRSLHFGSPPNEVQNAFMAAATIEAQVISILKEGVRFSEILEYQKKFYAEQNIQNGWIYHFPGGPTGYTLVDSTRSLTQKRVQNFQAFTWYTTVKGAKVEELTLLTDQGPEIISMDENWPTIEISTITGSLVVPGMFIR